MQSLEKWILRFSIALLFGSPVFAQVNLLWQRCFDSSTTFFADFLSDMATNSSGDVFFCNSILPDSATSLAGATLRLDADGNTIWQQMEAPGFQSQTTDIVVDSQNRTTVLGFFEDTTGTFSLSINQYDFDGSNRWGQIFEVNVTRSQLPIDMMIDDSDNIYIYALENGDFKLLKFSPDGLLLWHRNYNYGTGFSNLPEAMTIDDNGNVYLAGNIILNSTYYKTAIVKYDPDGNLVSSVSDTFHITRYAERVLATTPDGDVMVAGVYEKNVVLFKYAANDTVTQRVEYPLPPDSQVWNTNVYQIVVDGFGNSYITGEIRTSPDNQYHDFLLKFNDQLQLQWARFDSLRSPLISATDIFAVLDNDNMLYQLSLSSDSGSAGIAKISPDGQTMWQHNTSLNGGYFVPKQFAIDALGNLIIAGDENLNPNVTSVICKFSQSPTALEQTDEILPGSIRLFANYPNPFNPETVIPFELPRAGTVELSIFNIAGQKIATLFSGNQFAGRHELRWNGMSDNGTFSASGVYFAQLAFGNQRRTLKLLLIR